MNSRNNSSTLLRNTIWNQNWLKLLHRSNYNRYTQIKWLSLSLIWELWKVEMRLQSPRFFNNSLSTQILRIRLKFRPMRTIRSTFKTSIWWRILQINCHLLIQSIIIIGRQDGILLTKNNLIFIKCRTSRQNLSKGSHNQDNRSTDNRHSKLTIRCLKWGLTRYQSYPCAVLTEICPQIAIRK